jgi:hypothetical protein
MRTGTQFGHCHFFLAAPSFRLRAGNGIIKVVEIGVGVGTVQRIKDAIPSPFAVAA